MDKEIQFFSPYANFIEHPVPSLKHIPEGYKDLKKTFFKNNIEEIRTIKGCIPFLDALTMGYLITMPVDVCFNIVEDRENNSLAISLNFNPLDGVSDFFELSSHTNSQVPSKLRDKNRTIDIPLKLSNPWNIKTPPGYSCIFTQPFNRNLPYKIIDGVVDTDTYELPVNFPMYWTQDLSVKRTFLPRGYPIALVIPFKRDNWKMKVKHTHIQEHFIKEKISRIKLSKFFIDAYKKINWRKKSFK